MRAFPKFFRSAYFVKKADPVSLSISGGRLPCLIFQGKRIRPLSHLQYKQTAVITLFNRYHLFNFLRRMQPKLLHRK